MVKRQKEKQYLSAREQRDYQAIRSGGSSSSGSSSRRLPFSHCALTLQPINSPVCNEEGILFERDALAGFVFKFKKDPATGKPMSTQELIFLNIDKDEETGAWQCPILQKTFGDHVKVVAIRQRNGDENTANVYSYQAYYELNVKGRNFTDLTSGAPFDRKKDVIILCDPENDAFNKQRDINQFFHIQHERELHSQNNDSSGDNIRHSMTACRVLEKLKKKKRTHHEENSSTAVWSNDNDNQSKLRKVEKGGRSPTGTILAQDVTGVQFNTSQGAASLTSTGVSLAQDALARPATEEEILQAEFRVMTTKLKGRKGYVKMNLCVEPNKADATENDKFSLTIELHTDIAPRTCANFLGLCSAGEYDGCSFHRLIQKFMIQGGRARGGKKDESFWNGSFVDEFDDRLTHAGPGQVSMANSGANTNARQFFITFASCRHLDRKHSVFGKVVQGMDHLKMLEKIPTKSNDSPEQTITIDSMEVLENPAALAHDMEQKRLQVILDLRRQDTTKPLKTVARNTTEILGTQENVGKYLQDRLKSQQPEKP
ncbi:hypothetical protein ACA910_020759 [Epithemia clementina (nom. ined.)]